MKGGFADAPLQSANRDQKLYFIGHVWGQIGSITPTFPKVPLLQILRQITRHFREILETNRSLFHWSSSDEVLEAWTRTQLSPEAARCPPPVPHGGFSVSPGGAASQLEAAQRRPEKPRGKGPQSRHAEGLLNSV